MQGTNKKIIELLVEDIEKAHANIAPSYQEYLTVGFALVDELGEEGRSFYHRICKPSDKYNSDEADKQYDECLRSSKNECNLGKIIYLAKRADVKFSGELRKMLNLTSNTNNSVSHTRVLNKVATVDEEELQPDEPNIAEGLPHFPDCDWPKTLHRALDCTDSREKSDAMWLSFVAMVGGMVNSRTSFIYSHKEWSPCLQFFLTGESGVGKDVLDNASQLFSKLQRDAYDKWKEATEKYEREKALWDSAGKKKAEMPMPRPPKKEMPLITNNISGSELVRNIIDNKGVATIVSTEADSWTRSLKQKDWGVGSDKERIFYEHGRVSISRSTNREYQECEKSYVSILVSGTPGQIRPQISSAENGLFSRKLFYVLPPVDKFKSQFGGGAYDNLFSQWGTRWDYLLRKIFSLVSHIRFSLSDKQQKKFNDNIETQFNKVKALGEKDLKASVLRMGINAMRLMNILALIRSLDGMLTSEATPDVTLDGLLSCPGLAVAADTNPDNRKDGIISCLDLAISDGDFKAVLEVADVLLAHATRVARLLPKSEVNYREPSASEKFWELLPGKFNRKTAVEVANSVGFSVDAMDVAISRKVKDGTLKKLARGRYAFVHAREKKAKDVRCKI